jgi:exopolyphosphatase / guanosine-5'-triphosphate,3'-diphosphate pyrophosphatase
MIRRLGAIDIGSNTIKFLIADTDGQTVNPVCQRSVQTRLGSGIEKGNQLSQTTMEKTRSTILDYLDIGKKMSVEKVIGNATSAVRDAENGQEFVQQLEIDTGISIEVISGEKEASLIFRGITSTTSHQSDWQVILDVGGGSTEIIVSKDQNIRHQQSFNVGSVRLLEEAKLRDPLCLRQLESFQKLLADRYDPLTKAIETNTDGAISFTLVAAGGGAVVASMLLSETENFDPVSIELSPLERTNLQALNERLWITSLSARKAWRGMPSERADIVPIGTSILSHLLSSIKHDQLWVSTRGLRFGLLLQHYHETSHRDSRH